MAKHFRREMEKIKKRILALGALVEDRVRLAAKGIETRAMFDVERVLKSDYEIDNEEVEIEEECLKILALHQPVAVDLRFIVTVIKINNELERIADEAVNIAWRMKTVIESPVKCDCAYDYATMSQKAQRMLKRSLDALVNLDVDEAFKVCLIDDEVDQMKNEYYKIHLERLARHSNAASYLHNLFLISRHFERIADHATNIAEEVIYLVEGEIVRHGNF
ncbi:MAG: phosphate signaling complex protein PhoU [Desulfococcaceae bacterium]